jgi:hypothetical protein
MRRVLALTLAVCLLPVLAGAAYAETQTVDGSGDITKLVANNATNTLTAKVSGLGPRCGGVQYVHVFVKNRNGKLLYEADGDCISAAWYTGLFYTPTGAREDATAVSCAGFALTRTNGVYIVKMPRSCLGHAPDRVKLKVEGANYGTTTGGKAGPTKLLDRG